MAERLGMGAEESSLEISRKLEDAWRIVTRPQEYSRHKVKKANNLLEKTMISTLSSIDSEITDEEIEVCEALMLGLYHYIGPVFLSKSAFILGSENYISLN